MNVIAPGLTDRRGIGPVTAAQAIVSFSHPGRCRSDAAFAALAGTNPQEASSGRTCTTREIRRCLKRYITRELYRTLTATMRSTAAAPMNP